MTPLRSAPISPAPAGPATAVPRPAAPAGGPVLILGGGPIGLVCSLLLARRGFACTLVDARPVTDLQRDRRLLALSRGTLNVLEPLLGPRFAPMSDILRVHVSSRGQFGSALLGARDFGGLPVGATVWYADLVGALAQAAAAARGVHTLRPRRAVDVLQGRDGVRVTLDDGSVLEGSLAIDAEGTPPPRGEAAQFALLAELELPCPPGDAVERFTCEGPLALLPLPPSPSGRHDPAAARLSMVWCLPAPLARARLALSDAAVGAAIGAALGPRLGAPRAVGPRSLFPLHTHRRERVCENRLVRLGNAAQSLHPVAGQGFNLGIRDSVCLVQCLADARPAGNAGADVPGALQRYQQRRRLDRTLLPALTSLLPPLFSTGLVPVAAGRSAALAGLDLVPGVRRAFTRLLMFGAAR